MRDLGHLIAHVMPVSSVVWMLVELAEGADAVQVSCVSPSWVAWLKEKNVDVLIGRSPAAGYSSTSVRISPVAASCAIRLSNEAHGACSTA